MRVVLDTNVLMSGIFFSGPPHQILAAWRDERFEMAISPSVFSEYRRIAHQLARECPRYRCGGPSRSGCPASRMVDAPSLPGRVCEDADDQFIACAIAAKAIAIVSGDKLLRKVTGYSGVQILSHGPSFDGYLQ